MTDPPWWLRLPSRVLQEEAALHALYEGEFPVLVSHCWSKGGDGAPRILATVSVGSRQQDLEVRFPAQYPEGCPSVRPVPYDSRISSHQFVTSGILCLELGPDNWHPDYTAADMIRSARNLAVYERLADFEPIEIPSRHYSNLAERVRAGAMVLIRTPEFERRLAEARESVEFDAVLVAPHYSQVAPTSFPKGSMLELPHGIKTNSVAVAGRMIRLREDAPGFAGLDVTAFVETVSSFGNVVLDGGLSLVILRRSDDTTLAYFKTDASVAALEPLDISTDDTSRTAEIIRRRLSSMSVGIVGLGSLGSKVAVSLCRTGLQRFVLVDGDLMLGENVCRHAGTYRDVGLMKVDCVRRLLEDVSDGKPNVKTYPIEVGAATNPEYHAKMLEDLVACDVVVDATANPDVFMLLAGLASDHARPLVWGEVFAEGLGGLVGSATLDGPCPRCVRAGFLSVATSWPPAPHTAVRTPYGGGDGGFVAADADVTLICAALVTRIAEHVVADLPAPPAVLMVGMRRGWIFETPMQTVAVHVRKDDWACRLCWRRQEDDDAAAAAAAEALLAGPGDAEDPPAS